MNKDQADGCRTAGCFLVVVFFMIGTFMAVANSCHGPNDTRMPHQEEVPMLKEDNNEDNLQADRSKERGRESDQMAKPLGVNPYGVKEGQIWIDNDARIWESQGVLRRVCVRDIELDPTVRGGGYAYCDVLRPEGIFITGKRTRIRLDRFKPDSTGYRLEA